MINHYYEPSTMMNHYNQLIKHFSNELHTNAILVIQ